MLLLEVVDESAQQINVVVAARYVMPAAKVDPFHLRQEFAELFLNRFQRGFQIVGILFAQRVEMQAGDAV